MFNKKGNNMGQRYNLGPQGLGPQGPGPQGFGPQSQFQQYPQQPPYGQGPQMNPNQSSMYPGMQFEKLQYEIKENRRRINNLTKRIIRLENYLRIRDTSDYSYIDEDQVPNDFSM